MLRNSKLIGITVALALAATALPALAGEGRIPIWARGSLGGDGKYVLTRDLNPGPGSAIDIPAGIREVDIDLNGFTIWGDPAGGHVISALGPHATITIRNGSLRPQGPAGDGIHIVSTGKVVLEDLKIVDAQDRGIFLLEVRNFAVRRNMVVTANFDGLLIDGAGTPTTGTIEDNLFRDCGGAITVVTGASVALLDNRIERTGGSHGIQLVSTQAAVLARNTVRQAADAGIYLEDFKSGKLHNNVVTACGADGIVGAAAVEDTLFLDNVSSANSGSGIFVSGRQNHFDRNVLNTNGMAGLRLRAGSAGNTLGRNTMRSNVGGALPPCPNPTACGAGVPDFCDENAAASGNDSFGDNFAPGPC